MKKSILTLAFLVALRGAAQAATSYVAPTGNDTASGSVSDPFRTLAKGVASLKSGDTLVLRGGTYTQSLSSPPSGSAAQPTVVRAYPGETPVLKPDDAHTTSTNVAHIDNRSYITIDGLVMDGALLTSGYIVGVGNGSHAIVIQNSTIRHKKTTASACLSFFSTTTGGGSDALTVKDSEIYDCQNPCAYKDLTCDPANGGESHCLYLADEGNNTLTGNLIHDCGGLGIRTRAVLGSNDNNLLVRNKIWHTANGGVQLGNGTGQAFVNNLLWDTDFRHLSNPAYGSGAIYQIAGGGVNHIYHNTVYNDHGPNCIFINDAQGNPLGDARNNICYGNFNDTIRVVIGSLAQSNNLLGVDPHFINAAAQDFHLRADSPAIGAGVALSTVTGDFESTPRATADIGAFAFIPPVPPPPDYKALLQSFCQQTAGVCRQGGF